MGKRTIVAIALVFFSIGFWIGPALADDKGTKNFGQKGVAAGFAEQIVGNINQLTLYHGDNQVPCWGSYPWSPDGEWIVYMSKRYEENGTVADTDIYKMPRDGSDSQLLTTHGGTHPTFTSDGEYIVFSRGAPSYACEDGEGDPLDPSFNPAGGLDIWIMEEDGSNATPLTEYEEYGAEGKNKALPSPDMDMIVYHMEGHMYLLDIQMFDGTWEAGNPRRVADHLSGPAHYIWGDGTSGQYLLFDAVDSGHGDLVEGDVPEDDVPCGSNLVGRRIYRTVPDANLFYELNESDFESLTDEDLNVYDADGNVIATASGDPDEGQGCGWSAKSNNWPSFSPDGQWIAFHARYGRYEEGTYENKWEYTALRIMRPDGSGKRTLVIKGGGLDGTGLDPEWVSVCGPTSWGPDSDLIAFKMRRPGNEKDTKTSVNSSSCGNSCDGGDGLSPGDEVSGSLGMASIFVYSLRFNTITQITDGYDDARMWWNPNPRYDQILFKDRCIECHASRDGDNGKDLLTINLTNTGMAYLRDGKFFPIPTLSQWGLIAASLLLGGTGLFVMRRRKRDGSAS